MFITDILRKYIGNEQNKQSDSKENITIIFKEGAQDVIEEIARLLSAHGVRYIELLPYNTLAPAKYASVGKSFTDLIDKDKAKEPDLSIFRNAKLRK